MKYLLLAATMTMASFGALADKIDTKVNAIYTRMSAAYADLDAEQMKTVYDKNGVYLPNQKDAKLLKGHKALIADNAKVFNMLKSHNAKMSIDFRIVDRNKTEKMVTDIGYFVVRVIPPEGSDKKVRINSGKFITVSIPQADGTWAFYNDINSDADISFYQNAPKLTNLKYDS